LDKGERCTFCSRYKTNASIGDLLAISLKHRSNLPTALGIANTAHNL
jgi:hypothetical protein